MGATDEMQGRDNPTYDKSGSDSESEPSTSGGGGARNHNDYEIHSISSDGSVKDATAVHVDMNGDAKGVPNGGFHGSGLEDVPTKEMEMHRNNSVTLLRYRNVEKAQSGDDITRDDRPNIEINRDLLNQQEFDEEFKAAERPYKSLRQFFSEMKSGCECNSRCFKKKMCNLFPIVKLPKYYDMPDDLINDTIAGLTVGIMQIPQGEFTLNIHVL